MLRRDTMSMKWIDDRALKLARSSNGKVSLKEAEVISALVDLSTSVLSHPLLARAHAHERVVKDEVLQSYAADLGRLFIRRFSPDGPMRDGQFSSELEATLHEGDERVGDEVSMKLIRAMGSAVEHTIRTNIFNPERRALSLRLMPQFFTPVIPPFEGLSNMPYGVFFCAGRHFNGFHVRFGDIGRGGLRVVLPPSAGAHDVESGRHFMECFNLAWAQTLKNKDIPESGAKGVLLVNPVPGEDRAKHMHSCVQKMIDGMLDLITPNAAPETAWHGASREVRGGTLVPSSLVPSLYLPCTFPVPSLYLPCSWRHTRALQLAPGPAPSRSHIWQVDGVDYSKELIYLGPDENITPKDIEYIVDRAAKRGYKMPAAFMSSKPRAGINHKVYGVTSEGVAVFLDEALRAIGIEPKQQPWTVKLTGGPDGDVAGNMLNILHREYGEMVKVVGLADGTASAEDPNGLPMAELVRMFEQSLPLEVRGGRRHV